MSNYKFLFDRPSIDNTTVEKMMDFEEIYGRVQETKKHWLIRNTALITVTSLLVFFSAIYFWKTSKIDYTPDKEETIETNNENQDFLPQSPLEDEGNNDSSSYVNKKDIPPAEKKENKAPESKIKDTFKIKEQMAPRPMFVEARPENGFEDLYRYFQENLAYPDSLRDQRIEGKVIVEFVVRPDGAIVELKVVQHLHPVLDEIALASVKNMPVWQPATLNDEPIPSKHTIPLLFQFEEK